MLDILSRSIARAGGIEVADHVRIAPKPGKSALRRLIGAFRRYRAHKSAVRVLSRLDDRALDDIGLHRGILSEAADRFVGQQAANETVEALDKAA